MLKETAFRRDEVLTGYMWLVDSYLGFACLVALNRNEVHLKKVAVLCLVYL
jgi:hypothetical protein